jgi:hypothetical protein
VNMVSSCYLHPPRALIHPSRQCPRPYRLITHFSTILYTIRFLPRPHLHWARLLARFRTWISCWIWTSPNMVGCHPIHLLTMGWLARYLIRVGLAGVLRVAANNECRAVLCHFHLDRDCYLGLDRQNVPTPASFTYCTLILSSQFQHTHTELTHNLFCSSVHITCTHPNYL